MDKFRHFFKYIKPRKYYFLAAIFLGILYGVSSGAGLPVIIKEVLPKVFPLEGETAKYSNWEIIGIASLLPIIFLIRAITGYLSGYLMSFCSLEVLRSIKQDLFTKIQSYPFAFFDKFTTGDLYVRLSSDTSNVQTILLSFASEAIRQPIQVVGAVCFLTYLSLINSSILMFLILLVMMPLCLLPVQIIRKRLKANARKAQQEMSGIAHTFTENLDAVYEVRVFNLQDDQSQKYYNKNYTYQGLILKNTKYELFQQPYMEVLSSLMIAVTFVYAYFSDIKVETFIAMGVALYFLIDPTKRLLRVWSDFVKTTPMIDRLNEILDYKSSVPEPANPIDLPKIKGEIVFENVDFSYENKIVLSGASIKIPAGTSCALVGESGAGKSTFAKLVMRFYDPISGDIKLDGISLRDISSEDLHANIGAVPQYPVLFNDSIYNNIALAKSDATREEIISAARHAYADEFISGFDEGYDTIVGKRGDRLSGGQKQRIAIARVFLKNSPIIVLDEATSALDSNSEAFIQKALDELMVGRTVFIIAHRFSTIKNVQKIIVFKEGKIIDFGSHDELIKRCEHYKNLYNRQMSKIEA